MLKKLIKHDFRALSRTLFPVQIGVLSGTLLATLLMALTLKQNFFTYGESGFTVGSGLFAGFSMVIVFLLGMAVMASWMATFVIVCAHFYRNFLGDEGYLTFTLPVTSGQLLLSKSITGMLWLVISFAVICVSGLIFLTFGTAAEGIMNIELLRDIGGLFSSLPDLSQYINVPVFIVELLLSAVAGLAAFLLEVYFAIIVGGQVAKKHKVLAGIGMYLVINFVVGIVRNILYLFGWGVDGTNLLLSGGEFNASLFMHSTLLVSIGINALLAVSFYFWSRHLLKKRLNLQ